MAINSGAYVEMIEVDMYNPNANKSENHRKEVEDKIINILENKAPKIDWSIEPIVDDEDPDRIYVRGSFVNNNDQEFAAVIFAWNLKMSLPMQDLIEDIANSYERDRKEKENWTEKDVRKQQKSFS